MWLTMMNDGKDGLRTKWHGYGRFGALSGLSKLAFVLPLCFCIVKDCEVFVTFVCTDFRSL